MSGTLLLFIVLVVSEWLANVQVRSQPLQRFPKSGGCSMRGARESQCVLSCNLWYKHGMRRSCASETKTQSCIIYTLMASEVDLSDVKRVWKQLKPISALQTNEHVPCGCGKIYPQPTFGRLHVVRLVVCDYDAI